MTEQHSGFELWHGASRLNGEPIVVIITGVQHLLSKNRKTGEMAQVWILLQAISPGEAARQGRDEAVCGDCPLRNGRCYINLGWGPRAIWHAWKTGKYPKADAEDRRYIRDKTAVRYGSYGDPVAVPSAVLQATQPKTWTGYTHLWRRREALVYRVMLMASVESDAEALEAIAKGWRPFLVMGHNRQPPKGYIWCPSDSLNPAKDVPCEKCGVCNGGSGKPVAIYAHGTAATTFNRTKRERLPLHKANKKPVKESLIRLSPELKERLRAEAKRRGMAMTKLAKIAIDKELGC